MRQLPQQEPLGHLHVFPLIVYLCLLSNQNLLLGKYPGDQGIDHEALFRCFRNAAKNTTDLAGQCISHGGVWTVVQALGDKVKEQEAKQVRAAKRHELCAPREVPVLFDEAEDAWINIRGKDRPKKDRKLEMKVAAYEGWKKKGRQR